MILSHGLRFARGHTVDDVALARLEARALHRTGAQPPDLAGMLHAQSLRTDPASVLAAAQALHTLEEVEFVSIESLDALPPWPLRRGTVWDPEDVWEQEITDDLTASQFDYRGFAGMSFDPAVANFPAADGRNVRVSIVGYGVEFQHEDLQGQLDLQTGHEGFHASADTDTGTGIVGLIAAADNGFGLTGVAPAADFRFYADRGTVHGRVQGRVAALAAALAESVPGDVVLLALQDAKLGPAETEPGVWLVTRTGVDAGMHVVVPAGQGNHNLDGDSFASYRNYGDSGAIRVGQGTSIDTWDLNLGYFLELSRGTVPGTPYGAWIHLHGPGLHAVTGRGNLATLGHGSAVNHGPGRTYDGYFGGGGAAAALVAGAVAAVSSAVEADSPPISPGDLRDLLIQTARPQVANLDRAIGPVPDVAAALNRKLRPDEPAVVFTTLAPQMPGSERDVQVTVETSNPSGEALSYVWTIDEASAAEPFLGRGGSSENPGSLSALWPGVTYTARLTVVNARGMTAERSVVLPVVEAVPNSVTILGESVTSVRAGQRLSLGAAVRDQAGRDYTPDGGNGLIWSVSGGGTIDPVTGVFFAGPVGGTFTVTATAGAVSGTRGVTVLAPPVSIVAVPQNRVVESGGDAADLTVTALGTGELTFRLFRGVSRDTAHAAGGPVTVNASAGVPADVVFEIPSVEGVQYYWVEVTDGDGHRAVSRETRVGVAGAGPKSRYEDWRLSYGLEGIIGDKRESFAGDGIPNLIKYALGLDPRHAAPARDLFRPGGVSRSESRTDWVLHYQRAANRVDANTTVEFSTDLQTWSEAGIDELDPLDTPGPGQESRRVRVPLEESPGRVFFRLGVTDEE